MRFFPEPRRAAGLGAVIATVLAAAGGLPFLSGALSGAGWPRYAEIIFGITALVFLSAVVSAAAMAAVGRVRFETALATVPPILLLAAAVSLLLDLSGWWNDGSAYLVLRPSEALVSVLTLGVIPFRSGPTALIRFWPLAVALGLVWRLRPFKPSTVRLAASALSTYLVLAFSVQALSWVAGFLSMARKVSLDSVSDVFRLLVSAQSGGYWIATQGERFFAPLGRQAETGLAATQSAVWYLATCAVLLSASALLWRPLRSLAKRLLTIESLSHFSVAATGLGVGTAFGMADRSYTHWLSFLLMALAVGAWLWRERLKQDIENLAEDELERPHLPLPSGAVAPHELEDFVLVLACLAFFGAMLLGWPVLLGLMFAEGASWLRSRRGLAWGTALASNAVTHFLVALGLGSSTMAFGLRGFTISSWQVAALCAAAWLAAGLVAFRRLDGISKRRTVQVLVPSLVLFAALVVLRQPAVWGFGLLAVLAQAIINWHDDWRLRYRFLPGMVLLMTVAVLALAWPVLWRSF